MGLCKSNQQFTILSSTFTTQSTDLLHIFDSSGDTNCNVISIERNTTSSACTYIDNFHWKCYHFIWMCNDFISFVWSTNCANVENSFWSMKYKTNKNRFFNFIFPKINLVNLDLRFFFVLPHSYFQEQRTYFSAVRVRSLCK